MDLFLTVCELTLPVIVLIGLGVVCRARGIFDARAIDGLKRLISRYLMPFTLFNSLAKIELLRHSRCAGRHLLLHVLPFPFARACYQGNLPGVFLPSLSMQCL